MIHTSTSTMTDDQYTAALNAAFDMMKQSLDYCQELTFCFVYSYWNTERQCSEAWLTDGNCDMDEAMKYELICSYSPQEGE